MNTTELTKEQKSILDHTVNRAAGGRYCGGGKTMDSLCDLGLMKYIGKTAWCPDKYYAITPKGREALAMNNDKKPRVVVPDPECFVRNNKGKHCQRKPAIAVKLNGSQVALCEQCYQNVKEGVYGKVSIKEICTL